MKDIGEEVVAVDPDAEHPDAVARIRMLRPAPGQPDDLEAMAVLTDVVDSHLRFLAAILDTEGRLRAEDFWRVAGESLADYQRAHPWLAEKFARYDLFAPTFTLSCLNRLQPRNNQQMVDLADQASSLQFVRLDNPLAPHGP